MTNPIPRDSAQFTPDQIDSAIKAFLDFGEQTAGTAHQGYFSGPGWAAKVLRHHREALAAHTAQALPAAEQATIPDNTQNWAGMDGAIAWHLIDRHADGWGDVGKMMGEWLAANQAAQQAAQATAGWVSVDDWPAMDGETVLVCVAGQFAGEARHLDAHSGWWWAGSDPADMQDGRVYPTHVMAMPAPAALPQPQPQSAQAKGDAS